MLAVLLNFFYFIAGLAFFRKRVSDLTDSGTQLLGPIPKSHRCLREVVGSSEKKFQDSIPEVF